MTLDEKLDEALKETFPASDAFWLAPETALPRHAVEDGTITKCSEPIDRSSKIKIGLLRSSSPDGEIPSG